MPGLGWPILGNPDLTNEQAPSLGTLFYMAPEQADLKAIPDARWDVYALGAILYCLLVGKPPHHSEELLRQIEAAPDLPARLRCYRHWIGSRKPPDDHRKLPGVDRMLAAIIDRCLQPRPSKRIPNVQSVLDALRSREQVRARRPLLLLGVLGPLLLLAVMSFVGAGVYESALETSSHAVIEKVYQSNKFAAKFAASSAATEIEKYFRAIEHAGRDTELIDRITQTVDQLDDQLAALADPDQSEETLVTLRKDFQGNATRQTLQVKVESLMRDSYQTIASWFVCGPRGTHLAGAFNNPGPSTIGQNFAYRTYCYGGLTDLPKQARPMPELHVQKTSLSAPLFSRVTHRWKIAVSTPLYRRDDHDQLLSVLVLTVDVGVFMKFEPTPTQFAVLVDDRDNGYQGTVLEHPLYTELYKKGTGVPAEITKYRIPLQEGENPSHLYTDPLGEVPGGEAYHRTWIAASQPVSLERDGGGSTVKSDTGLLVLVQEDREAATTPVRTLGKRLAGKGLRGLAVFFAVVGILWCFVLRVQRGARWWRHSSFVPGTSLATPTPGQPRSTAAEQTPKVR